MQRCLYQINPQVRQCLLVLCTYRSRSRGSLRGLRVGNRGCSKEECSCCEQYYFHHRRTDRVFLQNFLDEPHEQFVTRMAHRLLCTRPRHRRTPIGIALLHRNANDARPHHAQCTRRSYGQVNNPAANERSAVVDTTAYRISFMCYRDNAPERPRPMGTRHFTAMTNSAVIGGKTSFSLSGTRNEKHRCCNQEATIHD